MPATDRFVCKYLQVVNPDLDAVRVHIGRHLIILEDISRYYKQVGLDLIDVRLKI